MNIKTVILSLLIQLSSLQALAQQGFALDEFKFSLEDRLGGYHSDSKKLWRMYQGARVDTLEIELSKNTRDSIRNLLQSSVFYAFPDTFKAQGPTYYKTSVFLYYKIEIHQANSSKRVYYDNKVNDESKDLARLPFLNLYNKIWALINRDPSVQGLPKSQIKFE